MLLVAAPVAGQNDVRHENEAVEQAAEEGQGWVQTHGELPAAAKAQVDFEALAARLKSCPDTKRSRARAETSPSATCKALPQRHELPPRVAQAQRFLAQRGWTPGRRGRWPTRRGGLPETQIASMATWQPVGPDAVLTPGYGLVTGRVSSLAIDTSDSSGNHVYIGTTGGGVWEAQNAAVSDASKVTFTPITDSIPGLGVARESSSSIGALTVQPGGTGVILAGTGDPNDALDSYYGAGILRSGDGGNSWSLISGTADNSYSFVGEGFAGFAWGTANPELVVAAVSNAYEGTLVNADVTDFSYVGLFYSTDGGVSWNLATITDGVGEQVQGPSGPYTYPDSNSATSVVWNPVRQLFVAAVRFHGYYQSSDGMTFTRMAAQPGLGLSAQACPTNSGASGSVDCPIFRGTLAVNPETGDTFAWTVDVSNQDQGIWQDQCSIGAGGCGTQSVTFAQQWNTQPLETNTVDGSATIADGDYNLALMAVPAGLGQGEDTWVLAGAHDLWKCSLAAGCVWRNTTNATTCMSAKVAEFQHALGWSAGDPEEILVGNDGGLWRSLDGIGESGQACGASDAAHFQNLNGGLGSLAEVDSMAGAGNSQYTMMVGLGRNGTAGLKSATASTPVWPQILGGYGGPVAVDSGDNWYVNNQDGVAIYSCSDPSVCNPAEFGSNPVVDDADVGGDGSAMASAAPFIVDPLDSTQLLIGTCRVWRGPANGVGWTGANAISPILDTGALNVPCNSGDALIRSVAALPIAGGGEVIYVGMYGILNGGASLPGHVLSATINPQSMAIPVWTDLTGDTVTNSPKKLNLDELDISSIVVDSHDLTGMTVYVTVEGFSTTEEPVQTVYGSTDGGTHWASLTANLPSAPVSGLVVDPQSASTVYLATDAGVYFTTQISTCMNLPSSCWSVFGSGLPNAPVVALAASSPSAPAQLLTAGTYGRGVWQTPLWTAGGSLTTAIANPEALTFPGQVFDTASSAQTVMLTNTGSLVLTPTAIVISGDFAETDNCKNVTVAVGSSCSIEVTFTPTATGSRTGEMTISANVTGGQLTVALSGTGIAAGLVSMTPASINFGQVEEGTTSSALPVTVANGNSAPVPTMNLTISGPFVILSNACGTTSLAAEAACQVTVEFQPAQAGAATGTLTLTDGAGTQTVALNGTGAAPPTDGLSASSIAFPATAVGQLSASQLVTLTNTGDLTLTGIATSASAGFQASNACGTQLAGHSLCSIGVVFAPAQVGSQTGVLTVTDALRIQTVALSGSGVQAAVLSVNPASLNFSTQSLGVASAPAILTISNTGGVAAANVGFQISGAAASSFAIGTSTCAATLAAGGSCSVQVIFTPSGAGGSAATLTVSSSTLGVKAVTVQLNGVGQAVSGLNVSPAQLTFAPTLAGTSSAGQTVTVSNSSSNQASTLVLMVSAGFGLMQNTCSGALAGGGSCTVGVVFAPTAAASVTGTLIVSSASIGNAATVELAGVGAVSAAVQVTPATISFPTTGVGLTSSPTTVTVTNSGITTSLSNLALGVPAGFQLVSNTCGTTLGPGLSCTAGVEFAPAVAGPQTGSLTVTSSTVNATSIPLQGTGYDFTVGILGANIQTVGGGQTASFTLVLTPVNLGSATFALTCGALPADAACVFSPSGETLNSGATGNVTLAVSTGSATRNANESARSAGGHKASGVWAVVPLACGLVLLPLGWRRRRRMIQTAGILLLLVFLAGGVVSCTISGGGGSGPGSGVAGETPAGTYSIPVIVTSTGVSHTVTVTLIVD
jgi:Abnormal spindle-like microcephaly-assoc'd, ASPM-SPD-2-Hydin